jgi:DNA repair exonuclease SbcCD ATPase subunit
MDNKQYHFLYKTTSKFNGKFYIGVHSTHNLDDNYLGSGYRLMLDLKKYGKSQYERDILEFFDTKELAYEREKEIVNEKLMKNWYCLNVAQGGGKYKKGEKLHFKKFVNEEWQKITWYNLIKSGIETTIVGELLDYFISLGWKIKEDENMTKQITIGELNDIYQKYGDLGFKVETPYGYKDIEWCGITEENANVYRCELENGMYVEGADYHKLKHENGEFIHLKEAEVGQPIQTIDGISKITEVRLMDFKDTLYDIQVADVHQYYTNGIVSHNTTLTIDAIKFLLHGSTTKTDKNEQIFNIFSGKNEVVVRGMIEIDGDEFIIERKLKRTAKKTGEWTVVSKVNYYEILPDGEEKLLNEEDSKRTTIKLRETVGTEKDFEMLVLATEKNLDEMIGLTTTESGKVLSRLIGLEILELKEAAVRGMYNEFAKKKKSNNYDVITLTNDIDEHKNKITQFNELNETLTSKLELAKSNIVKTKKEIEDFINSKEKIDVTITTLNPETLKTKIDELIKSGVATKEKINLITTQLNDIGEVIFDEDLYHELTKKYNSKSSEKAVKLSDINRLKGVVKELIDGGVCKACNRKLDDVDNTAHIEKHNTDIVQLELEVKNIELELTNIKNQIEDLNQTKQKIDRKNKLELDKDRLEVEIDSLRNKVTEKKNDLTKYNLNLHAIEHNKKIDISVEKSKTDLLVFDNEKDETIRRIERVLSDISTNTTEITEKTKLIETIKKEEEIERIFKIYIDLVGKKGIGKLVLRSVLPIINSEVQRLLEDVCDFEVEVFIDDKNDVQFLINKDETTRLLKSGSGFEKTAASLALRSVLGKMSTLPMPNFITFDEVLGKVASDNLDKLKGLFDKIKTMYDIVFLITHNDLCKDWASNVITVNKVNNISSVKIS